MDRLAELRERRGLTLRELSKTSGVSPDTINQIELGHRKARPSTLRKLARALEVDIKNFFEDEELTARPKVRAPLPLDEPERAPGIEVVEAYFVPLEEGEEEDTVEIRAYYARLLEGDEPILRAMREASPEEAAKMRQQREKAGPPEQQPSEAQDFGELLKERGFPSEQVAAFLAQDKHDMAFIARELAKMSAQEHLEALIASPGADPLRDYYRDNDVTASRPPRSETA